MNAVEEKIKELESRYSDEYSIAATTYGQIVADFRALAAMLRLCMEQRDGLWRLYSREHNLISTVEEHVADDNAALLAAAKEVGE